MLAPGDSANESLLENICHNAVLISTAHSAKGLEFEKVYFMNLELFPLEYLNERENASMVYVAMTRARKHLTIVSGSTTPTFSRIRETVQKYCADDAEA